MAINKTKVTKQVKMPGKLKKKDKEKLIQVAGNMTFRDADGTRRHVRQVSFDSLPRNIQLKLFNQYYGGDFGYKNEREFWGDKRGGQIAQAPKITKRKSGGQIGSGSDFVASLYK